MMNSGRGRYKAVQHVPDDASDISDEHLNMVGRRRKTRKGLAVMVALAIIIAFGLAGAFFLAAKPRDPSKYISKPSKFVKKALKKADIIDEVIPSFNPSYSLVVHWELASLHAKLGNTLKPTELQSAPDIRLADLADKKHDDLTSSLPSSNIILTMTDPDAPSRDDPEWSEFCHWIATGVPSVDGSGSRQNTASLEEIMPYKPPGPPPETGKHRYVFLVLVPSNGTSESLNLTKPSGRRNWGTDKEGSGVQKWADDMGLKPIAANFIYAQNERQ